MRTSKIGRVVLTAREGIRLHAYRDSKGIWTVGVGHAYGPPTVHMGMSITADEADQILAADLVKFETTVNEAARVPLADHEFDALVSVCFNIGQFGFSHATFMTRLNAGDRRGCAAAFSMWEKNSELIGRREAEKAQFLTPYTIRLPSAHAGDAPIHIPA